MFCPTCGAACASHAIACSVCGNLLPGLTDALKSVSSADLARNAPPVPAKPKPGPAQRTISPDEEFEAGDGSAGGTSVDEPPRAPAATPIARVQVQPASASRPGESLLGRVKLVVEQGRILGEQFLLGERELMIGRYDAGSGRCPDIDLTAQDPAYVHRQHVRLAFSRSGDQLMMYDMGGRNGCYLNNQLLERNGSALVQLGDKIRVGRVVLRVQPVPEGDDDRRPR